MSNSFPKVYSARIEENQGFDAPEPIPEINGWSVFKQQNSETYIIQHNLGLSNPDRQLHIVAMPVGRPFGKFDRVLKLESNESNQFLITTWVWPELTTLTSAFTFIAVHHQ